MLVCQQGVVHLESKSVDPTQRRSVPDDLFCHLLWIADNQSPDFIRLCIKAFPGDRWSAPFFADRVKHLRISRKVGVQRFLITFPYCNP